MTDKQHPFTPPPELLQQWATEYWGNPGEAIGNGEKYIAIQAAQWGANQELEACISWIQERPCTWTAKQLRAARRPKPKSLAEEALDAIDEERADVAISSYKVIRRALERLQELERKE